MRVTIEGMEFGYTTDTRVLSDIDLDISGPQLVSIIGPNGVGKSTLIHCINRILSPTGGTVMIDDVDVKDISIREMARIVGYVPYMAINSFPLSVVDTVLMGRHPHSTRKSTEHDLDVVYETLELLGIEDLALRNFNELSAGQHQKVMLARGLVQEPRVLLLDEPTANLDIKHQMNVTRIMSELAHEKGILVIMISHDINIAATYSDNVIVLHDGGIYAVGKPEDVIDQDMLRTVYGVESKVFMEDGKPHIILKDPAISARIPARDDACHVRSTSTVSGRMGTGGCPAR